MQQLLKNKDYITSTTFDVIRDIKDPEFDCSLEVLKVISETEISIKGKNKKNLNQVFLIRKKTYFSRSEANKFKMCICITNWIGYSF